MRLRCLLLFQLVYACPTECRCDTRRKIVFCNDRNFNAIPSGIPSDTKQLHLQENELYDDDELDRLLARLTSLESLKLFNNRLTRFPRLSSQVLREIYINRNRISSVSNQSFEMSSKLAVIVLDENELTSESIETGAFSSLTELRRISFARNNVKVFPAGMPYSLKEIYAPHNGMARIPSMALSQLTNVEILDLSHNQFTDESFGDKSYGLANLVNLRKIYLSYNQLRHIPSNLSFTTESVYLTANRLSSITVPDLERLTNLRMLDLAHNQLYSIERGTLRNLRSLANIDLSGNNWWCDCFLLDLWDYLKSSGVHHGAQDSPKCRDPRNAARRIDELNEEDFQCSPIEFKLLKEKESIKLEINEFDMPSSPDVRVHLLDIQGNESTSMVLTEASTVLETLEPSTAYRICVYNFYATESSHLSENMCSLVHTPHQEIDQSATMEAIPRSRQLELIVGIVTGLILMTVILAVYFVCWRNGHLAVHKKYHSPLAQSQNFIQSKSLDRKAGFNAAHSTTSTNFQLATIHSPGLELTADASKEFDVTLMLRNPVLPEQHSSYHSHGACASDNTSDGAYHTMNSSIHQHHSVPHHSRADSIGVFV